jgi:hypothetical protein
MLIFLKIMEDIEHYDIPVYNFPYDVEEDDEETIQDNSELRVCCIFAVAGLSDLISSYRLSFPSPSSVLKKKLKLMDSQFVLGYTLGALQRSTTQNTPTSAD